MKSLSLKYYMTAGLSIICLLGLIVYSNTFQCSFHFDDLKFIVNNPAIRDIHHLKNIWDFLPCRFILYLSFALNYHCHQLDVTGYHVVNLAVHVITSCLVVWFVMLTLSTPLMKTEGINAHARLLSLLAGLVFVSHPLQTEGVTYIIQRAASMGTMFYLLSLCFYIQSRMTDPKRLAQRIFYGAALGCTLLAMYTKEMSITLPLMIVSYEFCFLRTGKNLNWKYLAPFVLTIVVIPLTMLLTASGGAASTQEMRQVLEGTSGISSWHYFLTQLRIMVTYIRLLVIPVHQNLDYDFTVYKTFFAIPVMLSFLGLMAILIAGVRLFSRYRIIAFAIFWFFLTLSPESSFFPVVDVMYEHWLYLPLVGYSILLVCGLYYFLGRRTLKGMVAVLVALIAVNSVLTFERNKVWKDEFTLWKDVIAKSPHKPRPYVNLAFAYKAVGDPDEAIALYSKAIAVDPNYADAYYNRGLEYYRAGRDSQAFIDASKAIALNAAYAEAYNNRGLIYYNDGKILQAIADYNHAIAIKPDSADVYNNRAIAFFFLKDYAKAWEDVRHAQGLGYAPNPGFIRALSQASGR